MRKGKGFIFFLLQTFEHICNNVKAHVHEDTVLYESRLPNRGRCWARNVMGFFTKFVDMFANYYRRLCDPII